jgi:HEAT repeat protein
LGFLSNPDFDIIHGEVICGLSMLGDPKAIEPLLALVRGNCPTAGYAAQVLKKFIPESITTVVLETLRKHRTEVSSLHLFAGLFAEMGEIQAVPILIEMMQDRPENCFHKESVGRLIAKFGPAGFNALVDQLKSDSSNVRRRAIYGLIALDSQAAKEALASLVNDDDPAIRDIVIAVLPKRNL